MSAFLVVLFHFPAAPVRAEGENGPCSVELLQDHMSQSPGSMSAWTVSAELAQSTCFSLAPAGQLGGAAPAREGAAADERQRSMFFAPPPARGYLRCEGALEILKFYLFTLVTERVCAWTLLSDTSSLGVSRG